MSCETAIYIRARGEVAADSGDGLTFVLHGRKALESPAPKVYADGAEADPEDYAFDYGDEETSASITFDSSQAGKTITCDYRWKYECGPGEEPAVYEMEKELNVKAMKDANGRTMVVENEIKASGWRGVLAWKYVTQAFWNEIRILVESPGYTFDIERTSLGEPLDSIMNLYPVKYPAFKETPGVPGLTDVTLEAVQLEL
jgi:hypothetical protein